ncbi:MAG: GNAT family N-acetyltransferase [bacterium]|nr:GNAT family N-acetyltransferase [bacterium]
MLSQLTIGPASSSNQLPLGDLIREVFDTPEFRTFFASYRGYAIPPLCFADATVATHRNQIVGFMLWSRDEFLGVISGVGVRASHRRFGVASAMMASTLERLRDEGLRVVDVVCDPGMTGCIGFFEKHKFRSLPYGGPPVLMTRRLVGSRVGGEGFDA